ncbi:hypothetical protein MCAP1_000094 [Malassezia caprae]|uniref:Micro-fibrillar-associated protein 1 C-terminal domain-containing protein n=1 Tax=Malassezia caprae TaxID=1381934 RepID=A0AAF0E2S7_9BASI|nr:hypothetical protein MCAP1_000094 [Malassezia caprae]
MSERVPRPVARYRPGQAPAAAASDSSSDEEGAQRRAAQPRPKLPSRVTQAASAAGVTIQQGAEAVRPPPAAAPSPVHLSEYETDSDEDTKSAAAPAAALPAAPPPRPVNKQALPPPAVSLRAPEPADESSEYDTESESSEDEAPAPLLKPVFVSQRDRKVASAPPEHVETTRRDAEAARVAKQAAHELAAARVVRDLQEKQHEAAHMDVDDTDGLDPDAEFAAWRARELARLERQRAADAARQAEAAELQRRRALPEAERLAEDLAHARSTRQAKQRGQQGFLQKYYHKGAFFQDMDILQRDYSQSTVDAVDKRHLPQILQKRHFGQRSQSKWTHLAAEDTSRQGAPDLRDPAAHRPRPRPRT